MVLSMYSKLKSVISDAFVPFEVYKIANATPVWVSTELRNSTLSVENFCYGTPAGGVSSNITFSFDNPKTAFAERYGSFSIGSNGGGSRCGNIDGFQVKGVGRNCLAGEEQEIWHSYGGLNAIDATYEAVMSVVVNNICPTGAVKCHGVIITGPDTAYNYNNEVGAGALLIRECCIRPAHFLRAPRFSEEITRSRGLMNDKHRVALLSKKLLAEFETPNKLVGAIGTFLTNSSAQMAFGRAMRFCHGSINSSNICLDGRWLDLTNTGFLGSGVNGGGQFPFYDEHSAPPGMADELIYVLSKYNNLRLTSEPLISYYYELYQAHLEVFTRKSLGIPGAEYNDVFSGVVKLIESTVYRSRSPTMQWPTLISPEDEFIKVANCLYRSLFHNLCGRDCPELELLSRADDHRQAISEFKHAIERSYARSGLSISFESFVFSCYLRAISRAAFSVTFYKGRLEPVIRHTVESNEFDKISDMIEYFSRASLRMFNDDSEATVPIYVGRSVSIDYDVLRRSYRLRTTDSDTRTFETFGQLYSETVNLAKNEMSSDYSIGAVHHLDVMKPNISILDMIMDALDSYKQEA